ncbi:MAG: glycosyltransferase [Proteobacteria bacterium]|nr:glycosyltransferase [Pseudomonadota bacterium]
MAKALGSLIEQTFTDWEALVYDDGSTDNTPAVLQEAVSRDQRIRVIGSKRVGLVSALRYAIADSDAELLARMDADDVCHPERLADQVALLDTRPDLMLASSLIRCFPDDDVKSGMRHYEAWLNSLIEPKEIIGDILVESPLCHPSVTMRREAYEEAGGYIDDGNPEDYGLWLRFCENGFEMAKVPRVLMYWRESPGRLTRTDVRYAPQRFFELKMHYLLEGLLKNRDTVTILGAGQTGRMWSRALEEAGIETTAFVDIDPKKTGRTLGSAPVLTPSDLRRNCPSDFILSAVGTPGARSQIRTFLADLGLRDQKDFICVA